VFLYIYLDNLSPAKVAGYQVRAALIESAVDNFFTEKILNDFNAQGTKSLEMRLFRDFFWITHALCG